jgi:putative NADPH-quinone reductase
MNVFLVYAHAEPQSFNGAWFQTAQDTLRDAGHAGGFESRFQTRGR